MLNIHFKCFFSRRICVVAETVPAETLEKCSWLAIAWDRKVQVAKLVKSELKVYAKWTLDCPAVGVAWLDDQVIFCSGYCISYSNISMYIIYS